MDAEFLRLMERIEQMAVLTPSDFERMERLERACYDEVYIAPASEAYRWYVAEPRSTVALADGERLVGFVNLFPVGEETYRAILSGTYNDSDMTAEEIENDGIAPVKHLFLSCIVLDAAYRGRGLAKRLLASAAAQYDIADDALLVTDNVTADGCRLSERCGLAFQCASDHGTRVYAGIMADALRAAQD